MPLNNHDAPPSGPGECAAAGIAYCCFVIAPNDDSDAGDVFVSSVGRSDHGDVGNVGGSTTITVALPTTGTGGSRQTMAIGVALMLSGAVIVFTTRRTAAD